MLNGLDPIIIFQFKKALPGVSEALSKIPLVSQSKSLIDAPPIPIYLSEKLTGIFIDLESKNIDAETTTETTTDGTPPTVRQNGISNSLTIDLKGKKNSTGLTLFLALADLAYDKLTSQEYSISYLHGPVTLFNGLLNHFSFTSEPNEDLVRIKVELGRGAAKEPTNTTGSATTPKSVGALPTL